MCFVDGFAPTRAGVGAKRVATQRQACIDPFFVILYGSFSFLFVRTGKVAVAVHRDVQQPYARILRASTQFDKISIGQTTGRGAVRIGVNKERAVEFQETNVEFFDGKSWKVKETQGVIGIPEPPLNAPARE
jgi:hypothetical protein